MMTEMFCACHVSLRGLPDFNQQPCKLSEVLIELARALESADLHAYTHLFGA